MSTNPTSLYPITPPGFPQELLAPTPLYRRQALTVLLSLMIFFLVYVSLILISIWIIVKCFRIHPLLGIPFILLLVFLLKVFLIPRQQDDDATVEITADDHPKLFAFIQQLCDEVRAPRPHRVFLTPDVNAAVFYDSSPLNLVLGSRKNLLIGLGLVNLLTLDEFKAVLAHEFGHFSQESMRLSRFVYTAVNIIGDMVYGRDFWDRWVATLTGSSSNVVIAVGYSLAVWSWCVRKTLEPLFALIHAVHADLSRQMEFNADLVAVSAAGSDSIVHALSRLGLGSTAFEMTLRDLQSAAHHRYYTWDLYHHHTKALDYIRVLERNPRLGNPPALPEDLHQTTQVFWPGEEGIPPMWASHPSNYDRERNAKRVYLRSVIDPRSPWRLFETPDTVRAAMTHKVNDLAFKREGKDILALDPHTVQNFIDGEHKETLYDPKYRGMFDFRLIDPGRLSDLILDVERNPRAPAQLIADYARAWSVKLIPFLKDYRERHKDIMTLVGIVQGLTQPRGGRFKLGNKMYRVEKAPKLLKRLAKELEADNKYLEEADRDIFLVHWRMAAGLGQQWLEYLAERYRFQFAVLEILRRWHKKGERMEEVLEEFATSRQLSEQRVLQGLDVIRAMAKAVGEGLTSAAQLRLPALANLQTGHSLYELLMTNNQLPPQKLAKLHDPPKKFDDEWLRAFLEHYVEVRDALRRVEAKSWGALLTVLEQVATAWFTGHGVSPPESMLTSNEDMPGQIIDAVVLQRPKQVVGQPAAPPRAVPARAAVQAAQPRSS